MQITGKSTQKVDQILWQTHRTTNFQTKLQPRKPLQASMKTTGKANNFLGRIRTPEPLEKTLTKTLAGLHKSPQNKTNRQIGTNSKEINPSATKISREDNDTSKVTNRFQ